LELFATLLSRELPNDAPVNEKASGVETTAGATLHRGLRSFIQDCKEANEIANRLSSKP